MSHKSNPKILKIFGTEDWLSRGYYGKKFPEFLKEDFKIRSFLKKKLPKGIVENIEIERGKTLLKIIIKTARPALIIGRGGEGVDKIKKELDKILRIEEKEKGSQKKDIKIEIIAVKNPWLSASLTCQWMAGQIEKRVPFRKVLKMTLSKLMSIKEIKGARAEVAGRLNGIDISRTEWLQEGRLPRQRIRAIIDYGFCEALCTYGKIGIKVWIYKGDRE